MQGVRPKKFLGQHFLEDQNIASKIVDALTITDKNQTVIEIGPGTGVLSELLLKKNIGELILVEIDRDSVAFLRKNLGDSGVKIIQADFLKLNINDLTNSSFSIIGNFPYNISSQIFFKILELKDHVNEVVCMIQKEVADRICSGHGNKIYGILSVLIGASFEREMLFKVSPGVFNPPPKVESAVIRLKRMDRSDLSYDEALFAKIVKQGFQNRRKTLRNALKPIFLPIELTREKVFDKRAEQLSVDDFVELTKKIENWNT
ncbi:MAG: 16S rRNA (adenine(1518)-N(6)/adenine(1519)-N(6))-dimethyltransferase RsmA [Cytophagales bacterium]|nr:16S rRNA (adenine(1518)-N(6)/adenine(1519)-N(6))-dimethyltransferase RsmA [Cytophagales bacterium]